MHNLHFYKLKQDLQPSSLLLFITLKSRREELLEIMVNIWGKSLAIPSLSAVAFSLSHLARLRWTGFDGDLNGAQILG